MGCRYCLFQLIGRTLFALPRLLFILLRLVVGAYLLSLLALFRGPVDIANLIAEYLVDDLNRRGAGVHNFAPGLQQVTQIIGYTVILLSWIFTAWTTIELIRWMVFIYGGHQ